MFPTAGREWFEFQTLQFVLMDARDLSVKTFFCIKKDLEDLENMSYAILAGQRIIS